MKPPTEQAAADRIYQIRRLTVPRTDKQPSILDDAERRLLDAIRRNRSGTPTKDGFGSGRPSMGGEDAGSSTETAALANLTKTPADPIAEELAAAWLELEEAVANLNRFRHRLDLIDHLSAVNVRQDPSGNCIVCDRFVEGTANDRLRRGMCAADFAAWDRAGRPDVTEFKRQRQGAA